MKTKTQFNSNTGKLKISSSYQEKILLDIKIASGKKGIELSHQIIKAIREAELAAYKAGKNFIVDGVTGFLSEQEEV